MPAHLRASRPSCPEARGGGLRVFFAGAARRAKKPRKSKFVLNIFVLRGAVPEMRRRVI